MTIYFKNTTEPYSYFVKTESMEVKRVSSSNFMLQQQMINNGYLRTGKNIWNRFIKGLLTEKSFTTTNKNRTANVYYN